MIDNDLALSAHIDTFDFQSARHVGVAPVKNLLLDARTAALALEAFRSRFAYVVEDEPAAWPLLR